MGVFQSLSVVALRQLVGGACNTVGIGATGEAAVEILARRFTDHSQKLTTALRTANDRAWKAVEIALAGDSLWERCKGAMEATEDKAFAQQIRGFLDTSPFRSQKEDHVRVFREALKELRAARGRGSFAGNGLAVGDLAKEAGGFARFENQQALLEAEWKVIDQTARELLDGCPTLCKVLVIRPRSAQNPGVLKPSILAVAVRYYFRRAVEADQELFQGLAITKLEALQESQDKGFAALAEAYSQQGNRLEKMLADLSGVVVEIAKTTKEIDRTTKEIDKTTKETHDAVESLRGEVKKLTEHYQLQNREVRPSDSMSVRNDGERQLVKQLVAKYRGLPEAERQRLPGLLNNLGKLELAAGDFVEAQLKFQDAAKMESDPKLKAEAHYNAYQVALQRQEWPAALESIRQAIHLDPARFRPFPADYEPTKILGAGGFGVAFLCHHKFMDDDVVVKTLQTDELDGNVARVFSEAQALKRLDHPSIIRLSTCGFADADGKSRPYLAMDYFEGANLENFVDVQGPLSPEDLLAVAVPVAEALHAAHARGIFHRDVKPANILVRRDVSGWHVKLIDFGLALRPSILEGQPSTSGPRAQTTIGKSIAGTQHYAAPEQMGRSPGVAVGAYSDVYGFGKTCYYALFKDPEPDPDDEENLPESWRLLLRKCAKKDVTKRLPDLATVLAGLAELRRQPAVPAVTLKGTQAAATAGPTAAEIGGANHPEWANWNAALANVTNAALVAFYKKMLAAGQENYLRKRYLRYRTAGKRRWFVAARRLNAYVWQHGRFDGDIEFWRSGLHQPDQVKAVKNGGCLSFSLSTDQDFRFFQQAATEKLLSAAWTQTASDDEGDDDADGVVPGSVRSLYLKSKGIIATGYEAGAGFVVVAGSQAAKEAVPSFPANLIEKRNALIQQGVVAVGTDCLTLNVDHTFESASMAAGVMLGRSANGRIEWKDADGRTLKDIQNAAHVDPGQIDTPHEAAAQSSSDDEQYGIRKKFWVGLLSRPKIKTTRHANLSPGEYGWYGAGSGVRGLPFNYAIGKDDSRVELYIDRGSGMDDENKRMFDWLHNHKQEIEQAFGGELTWQRLDDKRACRISHTMTGGGRRSGESKWPAIQDAMIDAMIRLEKALIPHLGKLKTEFAS